MTSYTPFAHLLLNSDIRININRKEIIGHISCIRHTLKNPLSLIWPSFIIVEFQYQSDKAEGY
jgi:hypothetical protein